MKYIALAIAKFTFWLNRLTGSGGAALPGLLAKKIDPQILSHLTKGSFPDGIVVITGTNGKTTVSKLIADTLDSAGVSYVHNKTGSNLERGIISELVRRSDWRGRVAGNIALLEVDEASVPAVLSQTGAKIVLVTNLFRDQLDRYGELQTTAKMIQRGISSINGATVLLNADDPLVASLSLGIRGNDVKFYGISDYSGPSLEHDYTADSNNSPISDSPLKYTKKYFGHMGVYKSENGDFSRPKPDFDLTAMKKCSVDGSEFGVRSGSSSSAYKLPLPGLYNIYNALSAISVLQMLNIDEKITTKSIENSSAAFGRFETFHYMGREIVMVLIKNPTGFNQAIQTYLQGEGGDPLLLAINDNFADGRDISWLWDAAIEDIASKHIVVSGLRSYDMALRLKYADVKTGAVTVDLAEGLKSLIKQTKKGERAYILPTYTAMLSLRKLLVEKTEAEEYWR